MTTIKAVTFNLRCDVAGDGMNSFQHRKGFILDKITAEIPDIIGFQELTPPMREFLERYLGDYFFAGCGRTSDYKGEHNCIAYRKDAFELFGLETFWLSPTPHMPGTRFEKQSEWPRICTCALLKHKEIGIPFRVYNTHLDHISDDARRLGLELILNKIKTDHEKASFPVILMGDMNALPESGVMSLIKDFKAVPLEDTTNNIQYTFHNYGKPDYYSKIDYIFISREFKAGEAVLWDDRIDGVYLSDHYPICVQLAL